ncbi:MAG: hypothetical protein KA988_04175 [Longilinea sp.]|nr:hypothetical protein [Longilinea sp.]MCA1954468.1 hypothetical protein [Anaerolinea sp.]
MSDAAQPLVVGIRFSKVGKIYHFEATHLPTIQVGDHVVVETTRGWQLGEVVLMVPDPQMPEGGWRAVERIATPRDLLQRQSWKDKEPEVVETCKQRAAELKLTQIKVVAAEYSFDGTRLTILFGADTDDKVELKSLRQDMQRIYTPAVVELRQIGPRDVAKLLCGMGACGLETRCCCKFLMDFSSISIRMAKEQNISLTPTEITGMCGRLRCCLCYEYAQYAEARAGLPKRNKRVLTPHGEGKVVDVSPLAGKVMVLLLDGVVRTYDKSEIKLLDESKQEVRPENAE